VELKEEVGMLGKGAGFLGAIAVAALVAVMMLATAAALGLAEVMHRGLAFLLVAVVFAAGAAPLVQQGRDRIKGAQPVASETIESVKEDAQWARAQRS
jgi:hypothetical protein